MMNKSEPIIELRGICKAFGKKKIFDNTDLKIYQGDALVVIGPSGTGKSTILRLIAGLTPPDEGEIYIKGQKREHLIEDDTNSFPIGMVFQQSALFDSLTVRENVGFFLYQHSQLSPKRIQEIVDHNLEMVGLPNTGHLYPAELSGGMRKRISFARAVTFNPDKPDERPEVILYDEPTAGLDPIASTVIEDLVRCLQKSVSDCNTYVMVSHQYSTIRRTGDRIVFLYEGKIQWQGKIEEIDSTNDPLVKQFFSASTEGPIQIVQ